MQHMLSDLGRKLVAAAALAAFALPAQALEVFVCEPEWGALVRVLAPEAKVRSATHARQDPHHIEARPSLIAALRQADVAVCTGASLEAGWLPMLQQRAGNPRVQRGAPGMVYAADQVTLLDPRAPGGPFDGDVHAEGNPHLHLDPHRVRRVALAVRDALGRADPSARAQIDARHAAWDQSWGERIAGWERRAAGLRGMRVVAQHTAYTYLWRWLGIEQVADLEPKPGMPPTPGHLRRVLDLTKATPPDVVVIATYQDAQAGQWLSQQLRIPMLQLPATVTDDGATSGLEGFHDHVLAQLLAVPR